MPEGTAAESKGTCFVVMGFGKKTDFETGRTLDLDKTYRTIIKPAVKAAGLECVRADEIVHSGLIDVPMYEQLLNADVVVADLSTSNKNAFYELGVRHALKPYTTIVICEDGIKTFPFDVNHVAVRQYHHMGEGIDFEEVERFRGVLADAIKEIYNRKPPQNDSPVYTFLNNLTPPALARAMHDVAEAAAKSAPDAVADGGGGADAATHSVLMQQVDKAQKEGDFTTAKVLLSTVRGMMKAADPNRPEDPYIIQRLALVTYKARQPTPQKALEEARALLETLNPVTSNDTETLGLWGAVHKRLWDETRDPAHLDEAVRGYERGFYLRNDYYNGINLAYLLNVRAANAQSRAEAVADFVQAERVRREVLEICEKELKEGGLSADGKYWVMATMAEAYLGIGDEAGARQKLDEAVASADWMKESTREQMDKLRTLLADSPLKYLKADGE
jgi:MAP3K TRAFs-binding domain